MRLLDKTRRRRAPIRGTGYRLRLRPLTRVMWSLALLATIVFFAPIVPNGSFDGWWRLMAVSALVCAVAGLRSLWGPAIVVGPAGMRVYRPWWPLRRDIRWHRLLAIDIIPGFWFLEVEMNSGERFELPCVERMDDLYEEAERFRTSLDVID